MITNFYKYQGCGNDFVIVDNRNSEYNFDQKKINFICDRRFGIGADGFMMVEKSDNYDFKMRYYNSDGSESTMCGNGGRCIVAFAKFINVFSGSETTFEAIDGMHKAIIEEDIVDLKMINVSGVNRYSDNDYFLDTGSPHHIEIVDDIKLLDVFNKGKEIRHSKRYQPGGTNVNFIKINNDVVEIATFERGVEDETLACGTGSVAGAIVASHITNKNCYKVITKGGELEVRFTKESEENYSNVWLKGPAKLVFKGNIEVS